MSTAVHDLGLDLIAWRRTDHFLKVTVKATRNLTCFALRQSVFVVHINGSRYLCAVTAAPKWRST